MSKKMLIDATHAEETRVVVVEGNKIDEFDFETITKRQIAGNIYLAKVTRVEPSLQAAFVDYGGNRHGFLAFSEIHPDYYQIPKEDRDRLLAEDARAERASQEADAVADAEVVGDADAQPDEAAEEKPKPKRRRSRKKKEDVAADIAVEASDADAADAPVEVAEAAPVDADAAPAETVVAEAAGEEEAPKPKRRRAPRKKKTDESSGETQAEAVGLESDDDDVVSEDASDGDDASLLVDTPEDGAAAPKPKRRRSPRKKAVKAEAEAEAASEDAPDADADADANAPVETPEGEAAEVTAAADDSNEKPKRRRARGRRRKSDDAEDNNEASPSDAGYESVAAEDVEEEIVRKRTPMRRFKIQEVIRVRQILLVQVVKEERGNKGAALTTYLSLAGRYCVLMPNTARGGGVSRKITNVADRKKLKEIASEIEVPEGAGLIVRTAGARRTKTEIKRDYEYLLRLWEQIRERTLNSIAPEMIYEEGNLIKRSIRDLYSREIDEVIVDGENGYKEAKEYMKMLLPSHAKNVKHYEDAMPLFSRYQVENYLGGMMNPTVQLRSGGYLVINLTEALVAVDVNSGRATKEGSIEETALKTNMEAAEEVARQMRLRDLAGLIVIDFIDMEERRNNNAVEKKLKDALKTDRARVQVGRISGFGLLEMSRQRLRPGMLEATTSQCPHCLGTGYIRSEENLALAIMRELDEEGMRKRANEISVRVPISIANYLLNDKRSHVAAIEERYGLVVRVEADPALIGSQYEIERSKTATRAPQASPENRAVTVDDSSMLENADAPAAPAAAPNQTQDGDEEGRPKRRRRRRRGGRGRNRNGENGGAPLEGEAANDAAADGETVETASAANDGADAAPAPDAEATEEKPKRARRGRGREADAEEAVVVEETKPAADAEPEEKPKPKRRKKAAEPAVAAEEPAPVAEVAEAAEAKVAEETVAKKPKRAPRKKAAKPEVAPEAEPAAKVEAAPEAPAEPEAPKKPKRAGWWSRALGK